MDVLTKDTILSAASLSTISPSSPEDSGAASITGRRGLGGEITPRGLSTMAAEAGDVA